MAKDTTRTTTPEGENEDLDLTLLSAVPELTLIPGGVANMDGLVREQALPIVTRISFSVFERETGNYRAWPYVRLAVKHPSVESAIEFRQMVEAAVVAWVASKAAAAGTPGDGKAKA